MVDRFPATPILWLPGQIASKSLRDFFGRCCFLASFFDLRGRFYNPEPSVVMLYGLEVWRRKRLGLFET